MKEYKMQILCCDEDLREIFSEFYETTFRVFPYANVIKKAKAKSSVKRIGKSGLFKATISFSTDEILHTIGIESNKYCGLSLYMSIVEFSQKRNAYVKILSDSTDIDIMFGNISDAITTIDTVAGQLLDLDYKMIVKREHEPIYEKHLMPNENIVGLYSRLLVKPPERIGKLKPNDIIEIDYTKESQKTQYRITSEGLIVLEG
ncbi:MAG: hypothetical protein ACK5LL_04655 [Suipraeoptans sp.]